MANRFLVAAVQMVSADQVEQNIKNAIVGIKNAAQQGAKLVVLPEYFCFLSPSDTGKREIAETYGEGPIQSRLAEAACEAGVWLVGGTLPIRSTDATKVLNTQLVFDPTGSVVARYDKMHLFNFTTDQESYRESNTVVAGREVKVVDIELDELDSPLRVGLSTCYDLRFPELYRAMGEVDLIVVPAAFTATTGRVHWEVLLRARAIENQAYVLAAAQGGEHPGKRHTWGHSMLIDPWGEIISEVEFGEHVLVGQIDRQRIKSVRASLPALNNRVLGSNQ